MADSNQAKRPERTQFNENDPFAELTRIMGHEPAADEPQDLSIDLERELMGEFDFDEFQHLSDQPQEPAANADQPQFAVGEAQGVSDDFGAAFEADMAEEFSAYDLDMPQSGELHDRQPGGDAALYVDPAAEDDAFEQALHVDFEQDFAAEDFAPEVEAAERDVWQPYGAHAPDHAAENVPVVDLPAQDLAAHDLPAQDLPGEEPAHADVEFDMADVDMDFDLTELEAEPEAPQGDDEPMPNLSQAQMSWAGVDEADQSHASHAPVEFDQPAPLAVSQEDLPSAPAPAHDISFEDELSALLAGDDAQAAPEPAVEWSQPQAEQIDMAGEAHDDIEAVHPVDEAPAEEAFIMPQPVPMRAHPTIMSAPRQLAFANAADRAEQSTRRMPAAEEPRRENRSIFGIASPSVAGAAAVWRSEQRREEAEFPAAPVSPAPSWEEPAQIHSAQEPDMPDFDSIFEDEGDAALGEVYSNADSGSGVRHGGTVAPDIETVEVMEAARPVDQDFDVPDLPPEEDIPQTNVEMDDIEGDLASAFEDFDLGADAASAEASDANANPYGQWDEPAHEAAYAGAAMPTQPDMQPEWQFQEYEGGYQQDVVDDRLDDYDAAGMDYDDQVRQPVASRGAGRRRYLIAGLVAGVAVIGGAGVWGMMVLGGGSGDPILISADTDPMKVRPEDRGGTVVPNQESEAYQRVAGETRDGDPRQEQLISTAEDPLDLAAGDLGVPRLAPGVADEGDPFMEELDAAGFDLNAVKSEERIAGSDEQATQDSNDMVALAPRRVRTMVVRPDGSIVPREEVSEDATATMQAPAANGAQDLAALSAPVSEGAAAVTEPADIDDATVGTTDTAPAEQPTAQQAEPAQPEQEVASAANAAAAVTSEATSEWSMQIASQPSAEGAQSTYQDLLRRYGSLLDGRGVNIVQAEIDGRGTFYRVRIPANSRDEAVQLCTQYQAAGGSCFVSR